MKWIAIALLAVAFTASAQQNPFANQGAAATVPAINVLRVVPSDNCNDQFPQPNRALWVGVAGNVRVRTYADQDITIVGIQAGSLLPVVVKCVFSTGTTATDIQVWW